MGSIGHLENTLFSPYLASLMLDLAAHQKYNYYVCYVNIKDFQ